MFALLSFGLMASSNIQIGSSDNIHKNSPFAIGRGTLVFAEFYMFVVAAFVANVIVRDRVRHVLGQAGTERHVE